MKKFRALLARDEHAQRSDGSRTAHVARTKLQPLIESIARHLDPDGVQHLGGTWDDRARRLTLVGAIAETDRLIGILETKDASRQIFGPAGPTTVTDQLHSWVWDAVGDLWHDGYHEQAVEAAYKNVERRTQHKVGRRDLYGKRLYANAFSLNDPTADMPRLRFADIDKGERPDDWTSAHEGAMYLAMGCAQGIRNPRAHSSGHITEQQALEQLTALSVLARWVDECEVVKETRPGWSGLP